MAIFPEAATPPHVKICGIRRVEDGLLALGLGASFLGLILTERSKRHLAVGEAEAVAAGIRAVRAEARLVGVFVDEPAGEIAGTAERLGLFAVQVHGNAGEVSARLGPGRVIAAGAIRDAASAEAMAGLDAGLGAVLADAHAPGMAGGTGQTFDHGLVRGLIGARRVFLAGGLKPDNIAEVVAGLKPGPWPYAFDLSSGVEESPGVKSEAKLRAFFAEYAAAFAGPGA